MFKPEEGQEYPFYVEKLLSLPDGSYFVLNGPDDRKYLMESRFYSDEYQIIPGTEIICKVDKINCTGKVFFEPLHPVYLEGVVDVFEIVGVETRRFKKSGEEYSAYLAISNRTKHAVIRLPDQEKEWQLSIGMKVKARVKKTSKGEVHLVVVGSF
ncbi:MAG: hypothetical protein CVU05_11685 [Bacteroidetes bacterium HGW-Bacteroidetes-21]|jgi:hypothetical protein|nr:MAG: hypothetical protein CVU05_11685 [Bacteroidetes bacterium HGW-Bacteroidetes-21]